MDKYLVVVVVLLACILIVIYTQKVPSTQEKNESLKFKLQKAFPKYKVIERSNAWMICEINHRQELNELVIIRIDENQKKNIRQYGRTVMLTYPHLPKLNTLKKDIAQYLN